MHACPVVELFDIWRVKKRARFQYQFTFSRGIDCAGDMADRNFTRSGLKYHGARMNRNEANFGAGLPYSVCTVTNMRNVVCADTTGIQPHGKGLADCAGREAAFNAPMTVNLDVFPSKCEKGSGNGDDYEPAKDSSQRGKKRRAHSIGLTLF